MKVLLIFLFITLTRGIKLQCEYTRFGYTHTVIKNVNVCKVISVNYSDNSTHITDANITATSLENVQVVDFGYLYDNCREFNLKFIPRGFLSVFPNIIGLFFSNCEIDTLKGDELEEYYNLEILMIQKSNIKRVPETLFDLTPKLKFVSFRSNQILHVGVGLFDNLDFLEQLWFLGNNCTSKDAHNATQVLSLVEIIEAKCPDLEPESTTEMITEELTETTEEAMETTIKSIETVNVLIETAEEPTATSIKPQRYEKEILETLNAYDNEISMLKFRIEDLERQMSFKNREIEKHLKLEADHILKFESTIIELASNLCKC